MQPQNTEGRTNVLVTGGAGYIGSHTCKLLAQAGYCPVTYDDLSVGNRWAVKWGPLVVGDMADRTLLCSTLKRYGISAVIHFAASAYVGESISNPRKYFTNNVANTLAMLDCILEAGVRKFIFSSSCATYGLPEYTPIDEAHSQCPINPYGESKLAVEKILRWYGNAYGLKWVALRYFNAAGADLDGEIGEFHANETHLIPLAIFAALGLRGSIGVFGSDYPTPDGTAIRDYIHVLDLARAHIASLEYLERGNQSNAFNLGTGVGHSVREVISKVEAVTNNRISITLHPRREGDPGILVADASFANQRLKWKPTHSDLETIICSACRWTGVNAAEPLLTDAHADLLPLSGETALQRLIGEHLHTR